jgi:hypothetical protein
MKKRYLFIRFGILPLMSTLILVIISLLELFEEWDFSSSALVLLFSLDWGWGYFSAFNIIMAILIVIALLVSLVFLVLQTIKVFRYSAFPSISEAKSYFKVVQTIKEKQRLQKVKQEYQIKMAKLEEEKKKYL